MADSEMHSTGRGGSGNIGKGEGQYADVGHAQSGGSSTLATDETSTGRGGSGNIVHDPRTGGTVKKDPAVTGGDDAPYSDYHTGRAGAGNVHREKYGGHTKAQKEDEAGKHESLMEKAKHAVGLDKK